MRLAHFSELRNLPVNHALFSGRCDQRGLRSIRRASRKVSALLEDASLNKTVATVFVERGETVLTLFLGNLEHLINHKHQLFTYLKQMGVEVTTRDLYRFRGE